MPQLSPVPQIAGALALVLASACAPDTSLDSMTGPMLAPAAGVGGSLAGGAPSTLATDGGRSASTGVLPAAGTLAQPMSSAAGPRGQASAGRSGGAPSSPSSGAAGAPGMQASAGKGGMSAPSTGGAGTSAGAAGSGSDAFGAERHACVDTINMYRATLNLAPLMRASAELEACSDMGAKKDADANAPHSSAGSCRPLGSQNTCPGYPVRSGGSITATLNQCLAQMWAEGEPADGVDACIKDTSGCFQMHGHWINMQSATSRQVACGFYKMPDGKYWMNQNFGR